jgi:hypothetical protein
MLPRMMINKIFAYICNPERERGSNFKEEQKEW